MSKFTNEQKEIAGQIGQFYLDKNQGNYSATEKEINQLQISEIEVTPDKIIITTARPGLLIGARGLNVAALSARLERPINIVEVETLLTYLIPINYSDY